MKDVKIDAIDWESSPQVRARIHEETLQRYAEFLEDGVVFPPVDLFGEEEPYLLADGSHRVLAHQRVGRDVISARVHAGTADDATWFALGANRTHGLRLGSGDIRRAVELALKQKPDASQRLIAEHVGCSHRYVGTIREQVGTSSHLPERTVGSDGKSYPAATRRKSRKSRKPAARKGTEAPLASSSMPPPPTPAAEASGPVEPAGEESPPLFPPMPEPETTPATPPSEPAGDAAPLVQAAAAAASRRIRPDSNRIVAILTDSAAHLGDQDELIAFDRLDRDQTAQWVEDALEGIRYLETLVERLRALPQSKA